jgi:HK97 family phage major capsid protein
MPSSIEIVRANHEARQKLQQELREIDEKATAETRDYTEDESGRIEEARNELRAIDERITANLEYEVQERAINDGITQMLGAVLDSQSGDVVDNRSLGAQFVESAEFRAWAESGTNKPNVTFNGMDIRAVTDVTTGATSGGAFINPDRLARIGQDFANRKTYLIDVLPRIQINGPVEYVQDKSPKADLADKAVEVAEATAKPQAGPTLEVVQENAAVIAAWVNITRQTAQDAQQVMGYLDAKLRYSLKRRADGQVINGNGTSPNLSGLLDRSGINTYAPGSTEAWYKTIRHGITLMEQDEQVPEIVVLNPADAEIFDLSNDTDAGLHAVPNVAGPSARTAWGLTQVRSNAIASGTAMLIDPMAVMVLDRQQPTAYMTDSHGTNFTSNILTLLLEMRLGLALFEPEGVCQLTFND